jgi:hypothetical protein
MEKERKPQQHKPTGQIADYRHLDSIVYCLRRHSNRLPLKKVLDYCEMARAAFEAELEKADCPLAIRFEFNGGLKPEEIVSLKDPQWTRFPVVSQQDAANRLNAMSYDDWLNHIDPTRKLRLSNKRGHRRTSTGADEYLNGHDIG